MIKLDLKDKKIMYELDKNSRQSYQQIGRKVKASKEFVFNRIKRLKKEGVIEKYQTVIDMGKLGYGNYRINLRLQNTDSKVEEEIIEYLRKQELVGWVATVEGYWNVNLWLLSKGIAEVDGFWEKFTSRYINYIAENKLTIFTDIKYYARSHFLKNKKNDLNMLFGSVPKKDLTDKTDKLILNELTFHARMPTLEIAKKVNLSAKQVAKRIKDLERKEVITGYRIKFDLSKLNYLHYHLDIKIKDLTKAKKIAFLRFCYEHPNITYSHRSICGPDVELDLEVESITQLREIIQEMKDKFSDIIQKYNVSQYLKQHKLVFIPVNPK